MPGNLTANNATIGGNAQSGSQCSVNGANDTERAFQWRTGGTLRAELLIEGDETGSDAGGDLRLPVYADDGTTKIADAMTIERATGGTKIAIDRNWRVHLRTEDADIIEVAGQDCDIGGWTTFAAGRFAAYLLDFDKDAIEGCRWAFILPPGYDGSPIKIRIHWTATSGTTGDVYWQANLHAFGDDDALTDTTLASASVVDTFLAQDDLHICSVTITPSAGAAGNIAYLRLNRSATHANDTFDADARLIAVNIGYE